MDGFAVGNVPPGEYVVAAMARPGPALDARRGLPVFTTRVPGVEYGRMTVAVGGIAPPDLVIQTAPPALVTGHMVVEGGIQDLSPLAFTVGPAPPGLYGYYPQAPVASDWTFEVAELSGPSRIVLMQRPAGWWLRSAMIDGIDAAVDPVEFHGSSRYAVVATVARTVDVGGAVTNASGRPASRYVVVAFSVDAARRFGGSAYVQTAAPDRQGLFRLDLPPGEYWMAAVERLDRLGEPVFQSLQQVAERVLIAGPQPVRHDLRLWRLP